MWIEWILCALLGDLALRDVGSGILSTSLSGTNQLFLSTFVQAL